MVRVIAMLALGAVVIAVGIGLGRFGYDYFKGWNSESARAARDFGDVGSAAIQEWQLARADHEVIAAAVAACSNIFDLDGQPNFIRAELRLDTLPNGSRGYFPGKDQKSPANLVLSNYQRAVIYLSDSIMRSRVESANNANLNYSSMFWFQLAIVGIGAITTILISIKSIAPAGNSATITNLSLWVGIPAIIFSSLGTATSALKAFYGPRQSYLKNERSLAALRQLHSDIAAKIASTTMLPPDKCPKFDPKEKDDPYGKQIQDWAAKLGAILNTADSGSSSSQNTSSTTGTNLPKGIAPAPAEMTFLRGLA